MMAKDRIAKRKRARLLCWSRLSAKELMERRSEARVSKRALCAQ